MLTKIDKFLNKITMYRLTLFVLLGLSLVAMILALFSFLPYDITSYLYSFLILVIVCYVTNILFTNIFSAKATKESTLITALILFLVLFPAVTISDAWTLVVGSILAIGSKYLVAIRREHLFNPAAFAMVALSASGSGNVAWWIGSSILFPFSLIAGFLIVRKIRRFQMVSIFIFTHILVAFVSGIPVTQSLFSWPIIFFGAIMLTEPFTAPAGHKLKIAYAIMIGILSAIPWHFGSFHSSPELALLIGNFLVFFTSTRKRLDLKLISKKEIAKNIYEFSFLSQSPVSFKAGQYLEWTLPHSKEDARGIRRYFTIASSPTETELKLGVKIIPDDCSTYKKALLEMKEGDYIYAENLDGDFLLPSDNKQKLVFIAGGIGVTPFRAHIQYMLDSEDRRDTIIFYASKTDEEIAYKEVFFKASDFVKIHYIIKEFITEKMIKERIPDFKERLFYISGPDKMVDAYKKLLKEVGIKNKQIITDYFPGY